MIDSDSLPQHANLYIHFSGEVSLLPGELFVTEECLPDSKYTNLMLQLTKTDNGPGKLSIAEFISKSSQAEPFTTLGDLNDKDNHFFRILTNQASKLVSKDDTLIAICDCSGLQCLKLRLLSQNLMNLQITIALS